VDPAGDDLGFDASRLLTITVSVPRGGDTNPTRVRFFNDVVEWIRAVSGVQATSAAACGDITPTTVYDVR
jgi:hypothetical protein